MGAMPYSIVALVTLMIIQSIVLITCALRCVSYVYLGPMDTRKQVVKSREKKHGCIGRDPYGYHHNVHMSNPEHKVGYAD